MCASIGLRSGRGRIARYLGLHQSTVKRALTRSETTATVVRSKLIDPFIPLLTERLPAHPELSANVLWRTVVEHGYTAGLHKSTKTEVSWSSNRVFFCDRE
ncbi:MAG: hypothetical protein OXE94_04425 [Aestuariivita sp.]|nr:hypothetical protein [Aestuariivita sp.]MCY4202720.1 hypothetical protein [Aestuariivita sp.]